MQFMLISTMVAILLCGVSVGADKVKQATQPVYQTSPQQFYNYRQHGVGAYDYNNAYRRYDVGSNVNYGQYPATAYDTGAQYLHLSGGVYRPYEYDYTYHSGYKPYSYDNTYKYYDNSAAQYVAYPQGENYKSPYTAN